MRFNIPYATRCGSDNNALDAILGESQSSSAPGFPQRSSSPVFNGLPEVKHQISEQDVPDLSSEDEIDGTCSYLPVAHVRFLSCVQGRLTKKSLKFVIPMRIPDSVPYVTAIVLEVLRWTAAVPNGIINTLSICVSTGLTDSYVCMLPHYINADDIYNGHLIPGGSIVIANLW
jgi:hypothetical protein